MKMKFFYYKKNKYRRKKFKIIKLKNNNFKCHKKYFKIG